MIFVQSEYVHIKINCPLSSKLFIQQPEFKKKHVSDIQCFESSEVRGRVIGMFEVMKKAEGCW